MNGSVKQEFDNKIGRLTKSNAYLDYCEEVYGYRMYLFNMMDKEQLDFVFHAIPISLDDTILDLGCGSGSMLNALVNNQGCRGIGIDQLSKDVIEMDGVNAQYINGDIDDFEKFSLHPTVTLLVDSIYFSRDMEGLIRALNRIEGNRTYLFYSQYLFKENKADKNTLQGDFTNIAELLKKIGIAYETVEYSKNERAFYERSLHELERRKNAFMAEGNIDLYEDKMEELRLGKHFYDTENASRYLYIIG